MLVIKDQQMKQLSAELEAYYMRRTAAQLREQYPAFAGKHTAAGAEDFVKAGVKMAKRYRITDQRDTLSFLKYLVVFGTDFSDRPEHESLRRILLIRNLKGTEKIRRMLATTDPDNPEEQHA